MIEDLFLRVNDDKMKRIVKMIGYPHPVILTLMIGISFFGLIAVFSNGLEKSFIAYLIYPISAYSLCVSSFHLVKFAMRVKHKVEEFPVFQVYFHDDELRKTLSILQGTIVSLLFAVFKCTLGAIYQVAWEMAIGIYYMIQCMIRINLARVARKVPHEDKDAAMKTEWINYMRTGILMFVLNAAMSGMVIQMIWLNKSNQYPGFFIYVSALHAFYSLTNSVWQIFKFRKSGRPLFYSANAVNLAGALVSILVLQAGLLNMFADSALFQRFMNGLTGTFVMASVFAMAVQMVIQGINHVRQVQE